jgi:hypothetical protein
VGGGVRPVVLFVVLWRLLADRSVLNALLVRFALSDFEIDL